jgi:hypothetical protein
MAFNRARTLGIHFDNHRLQGKLLQDFRDILNESAATAFVVIMVTSTGTTDVPL